MTVNYGIETVISTEDLVQCANIVNLLEEDEVRWLGHSIKQNFTADKDSRADWEQRNQRGMNLALQVAERKTFPWEGAANVKFPLITIAALQYQSRAYPALLNGPFPVGAKPVVPGDPDAEKRAKRIGAHMSFQLLEEMLDWEEETDKSLLIQAIMGCCFKKTWYDPVRGINRSVCVNPRDLYANYWTTSIEEAPRVTHLIYMSHNAVREMQIIEVFSEFDSENHRSNGPLLRDGNGMDKRQGTTPPPVDEDTPYELLEQCLYLDLDGDDYREPYVATVVYATGQVLRIAPLYTRRDIVWTVPRTKSEKPRILRIDPCGLYTKYTFIPSPDGGFYDLGFGALLGPISETIDSGLNQMLDAGTLANAGGGFLGKGAKMKKGDIHQSPGKWTTLDCLGNDLKANIVPLPVPPPNPALFQLISLLIEYGQNVAGSTDIMLGGNPGQNTPAQTTQTMVEQGMTTFNGIYKRTHKAFTRELRKLYRLNINFLADGVTKFYTAKGNMAEIFSADYAPQGANLIRPAANPFYMSDTQKMNQSQAIFQAAMTTPGWNRYQAGLNWLEAWKCTDPDRFLVDPQLMKDPKTVPAGAEVPQNPKMLDAQSRQIMAQAKQSDVKNKMDLAKAELQMEAAKLKYEIGLLSAQAAQAMATAKGVEQGHAIALLEAQIGAKNAHLDSVLKAMSLAHDMVQTQMGAEDAQADRDHERSMATVAPGGGNSAGGSGA